MLERRPSNDSRELKPAKKPVKCHTGGPVKNYAGGPIRREKTRSHTDPVPRRRPLKENEHLNQQRQSHENDIEALELPFYLLANSNNEAQTNVSMNVEEVVVHTKPLLMNLFTHRFTHFNLDTTSSSDYSENNYPRK